MKKHRQGLSISDLLISLVILGFIAALTVPTLIASSNTRKYYTALKKNISVLSSAIQHITAEDNKNLSDTSITNSNTLAAFLSTYLAKVKTSGPTVWLSDGTKMQFVYVAPTAPQTGCAPLGTVGANTYSASASAFNPSLNCYVIVDINGDKAPNRVSSVAAPSDIYILGLSDEAVFSVTTAVSTISVDGTAANGFGSISGTDISIRGDDGLSSANAGVASVGNSSSMQALKD